MRGKYGEKGEVVPGPGQYEYKNHLNLKEKGHDFGKDARSKYQDTRVPGPGSYAHESAVFKYGSKQEPSYGFGSRLAYNTDGYIIFYQEKFLALVPTKPRKKYTHISVALWARI